MISLREMLDYAEREYSDGGLYKEYVDAKALKYATFERRIKKIASLTTGKKILDVGCGCGYFIDVALKEGFDAYGVEFSSVAISYAEPQTRERIFQGDVNQLDASHQGTYDVITAFDILEHTLKPIEFLDHLRQFLVPNGLLVIATPNTHHFLRAIMRTRWPMLQPYQHTYLFSARSLVLALEKAGYHVIQVMPARKVLTPEYLAEQLRSLNPTISRLYNTVSPIIPKRLQNMPIELNIGESMAFARCSH